jgi:hypothetical protein
MAIASTINDLIRVSDAYAEGGPTEVSMDDLQAVMGGSLRGLADAVVSAVPGAKPVIDVLSQIPGAVEEVVDWYQETYPSDAAIAQSQATNQAAGEAASRASYQAEMNAHAGDTRIVSGGYY